MNPRYFIFISMLLAATTLVAQNRNTMITDENLNKGVLVGQCDKKGLQKGTYGAYFNSQYELYKPAENYIKRISKKLENVEVKIVFGSWCHDSKLQVPRFIKVLDQAGYDERDLFIIGVNSKKNALIMSIDNLNIERVPTFIFYKNGVELGRIIETPKKTMEKDIWKIVRRAK